MNQTPEEVTLFAELDDNLRSGTLQKDALIQVFSQYSDIYFPLLPQPELSDKLTALYCEGMIDKNQLNEYFASLCLYVSHAAFHPGTASNQTETLPLFVINKTIGEW
ncbi:hypothetical protein [Paenibacillus sp. N3.4]|uniref:hypothetical protein n=1 Tax=Paenibacillus sp. N3.4 TaxID=2603222 RepID=UPI0011CAF462|nr:hypothetical protein [Paenibacillus sp. N3.4]TXK71908.1 hypothetical protein FU659_32035 [Paenibacillus sp. N3.4]